MTGCRDEHIRVWDMGTDKCVRLVKGHSDEVSCLAVSGQTLWSGSIDGTVRSWDLAGISCLHFLLRSFNLMQHLLQCADVLAGKLSGDATAEEQELLAEEAAAAEKPSLMTAEEEAELADLMDL